MELFCRKIKTITLSMLFLTVLLLNNNTKALAKDLEISKFINSDNVTSVTEEELEEFKTITELNTDDEILKTDEGYPISYDENGYLTHYNCFSDYVDYKSMENNNVFLNSNQLLSEIEKSINTNSDNASATIEDIVMELKEKKLISEDYYIGTFYEDDFKQITLYKRLNNGIKNFYNSIGITLDKDTNEIIYFDRMDDLVIEENDYKPKISFEEVEAIVYDILSRKQLNSSIEKIELSIIRIDEFESEDMNSDPNIKIGDDYFLSYEVFLDNNIMINIDPENGDIINFIAPEAIGVSFYDRETGRYRWERADNIAKIMREWGLYSNTQAVNSNTSYNTRHIKNIIENSNKTAFSYSGHSTDSGRGIILSPGWSTLYGRDCNTSYRWRFVFMDCCQSAAVDAWTTVFRISNASKDKVFLGWLREVPYPVSHQFTQHLLYNAKTYKGTTIYDNVNACAKKTRNIDQGRIKFMGDRSIKNFN